MLRGMRKHAKYFYVLFFIVILTFIFWGVGGVDRDGETVPVAEVEGEKITLEEYWRAYDRMENTMREVYPGQFDEKMREELKKNVMETLIAQRVLLKAARDAGISVSDQEVEDSIVSDKNFIRDGSFRKDIYLRTLEMNRLTPEAYEALKRQELLMEKMRRLIEDPVTLSPSELAMIKGDEQTAKLLRDVILGAKKERALKSYVEGLKKGMKITEHPDIIS
jgi:peptidyl-prolyl cis-trans isomerase D